MVGFMDCFVCARNDRVESHRLLRCARNDAARLSLRGAARRRSNLCDLVGGLLRHFAPRNDAKDISPRNDVTDMTQKPPEYKRFLI